MKAAFFLILSVNLIYSFYQQFFQVSDSVEGFGLKEAYQVAPGKNLSLLSEVVSSTAMAAPATKGIDDEVANVEDSIQAAPLCTMLGPYEQLLQAEYAVEHLSALGASAQIVPVEIKEGESFWVYLPPEVSEREALNRLYELQGKGVESHIITKGDLVNAISLGRFSLDADARARAEVISQLGYHPQIKSMPKTIQETWVAVAAQEAEKIDSPVWEMLIARQVGLERRKNYCLGIANH